MYTYNVYYVYYNIISTTNLDSYFTLKKYNLNIT